MTRGKRRPAKPAKASGPAAQSGQVPVSAAAAVAQEYGLKQVILLGWDGQVNHCVTYGDSVQDCDQAALGGDLLKRTLGWPAEAVGHLPPRVQEIQDQLTRLRAAALAVVEWYEVNPTPKSASLPFETLRALVIPPPLTPQEQISKLQERVARLETAGQRVVDDWDTDAVNYTPNVERLRDAIRTPADPPHLFPFDPFNEL